MKNPKWVAGIRALTKEHAGWYDQRGWNKDGIIKTMSRIDVPTDGASLPPGPQRIAGVAYAGDRGVSNVEFSADGGGTWETADFVEPPAGKDTMVRWQGTFTLAAGARVTLVARATDGAGDLQIEGFSPPQPE